MDKSAIREAIRRAVTNIPILVNLDAGPKQQYISDLTDEIEKQILPIIERQNPR